jgi:uncharacterized protein YheU (UPF0270 family)
MIMSLKKTFIIKEGPEGLDPNQGSDYGARAEALWKQLGTLVDIKLVGNNQATVIFSGDHGSVELMVQFDEQGKIVDVWD